MSSSTCPFDNVLDSETLSDILNSLFKSFLQEEIMGFERSARRGNLWDDVVTLDEITKTDKFNYTSKD